MNRRQSVRIARAELRRRFRAVTDDVRQLIAMALTGLFVAVGVLGGTAGAYFAGRAVANGNVENPATSAELIGAGVVVFVGFLLVVREMNRGSPPALAGHLTTVSAPTLAAGYLLTEYAVTGLVFVPLALLGAGAFAAGAGDPLTGVAVLLAALAAWTLAVPVWQAALLAVQYAFARVPALARRKGLVGGTAFAAYMLVFLSGEADTVLGPVLDALAATPAGWFAHIALLRFDGVPLLAGGALLTLLAGAPLAVLAVLRLSDVVWHADPLPAEEPAKGDERVESSGVGIEGRLPISRPTAAVVRRCWRRGRRSPITLVYVPYPLFFLAPLVAESLSAGRVVTALPVVAVLYAPWAVGAAFTLNPLGDEGAVLPVTVTSGVGGERYVAGRMLAALIPGLPLAVLLALVLGVASPLSLSAALALAGIAAVLSPAAAAVAAGFGTTLPNTESSTVFRSREAVMPSPWAFLGFSVVLACLAAPGLVVWLPLSADLLAGALGVDSGALRALGTSATVLAGALVGFLGFRIAARAVSTFELD